MINFKPGLAFLLLALAITIVAGEASEVNDFSFESTVNVGDLIGEENEMLMESETNRRTLEGQQRYISYGSLQANQVPCGRRGQSYYNCQQRGQANPYNRGCSQATHCARDTS
ncbi:protein RALF-like 19 [Cicer arietinum]|uniref:Protein RALF-like 19 n=1 Tax=Cicer arietinum TaxID=3827 RepID=A0A1S2YHX9_CICAR|nr:protein RALF-like 19 [Cicer arietinum]